MYIDFKENNLLKELDINNKDFSNIPEEFSFERDLFSDCIINGNIYGQIQENNYIEIKAKKNNKCQFDTYILFGIFITFGVQNRNLTRFR